MDRQDDSEQKSLSFFNTNNFDLLPNNSMKIKKKKQGKGSSNNYNRKKGFSDEQIKSLETVFESETKPEPKKKVEIAAELGLQPRQVAIWFQNRRARWKSKRVEQEYSVLKASYDNLVAEYEVVQKEKHDLLLEVKRLRNMVGKSVPDEEMAGRGSSEEYHRHENSADRNCEEEMDPVGPKSEDLNMDDGSISCRYNMGISVEDRLGLLNMKEEELEEEEDGSLGLLSFGSSGTSEYSLSNTAWWNCWT